MTEAGRHITPVILTLNEAANIERTLSALAWADRVVVVDSGSTDRTREIARSHHNVSFYTHAFASHGHQWNFAIFGTDIETRFVLALDADMVVTEKLHRELDSAVTETDFVGAILRFRYAVHGVPLLSSLLAPQLRLLSQEHCTIGDDGHSHRFSVDGAIRRLRAPLIHDDRKPLEQWVEAQLRYSRLELPRLVDPPQHKKLKALVRRTFAWAPLLVAALAYFRSGGPLRGAAARRYALERLIYEALLRWRFEDQVLADRERRGQDSPLENR